MTTKQQRHASKRRMTTIIKQNNTQAPHNSHTHNSCTHSLYIPPHLSHIRIYNPDITHDTHATRNRSHRLNLQRERTDNTLARIFSTPSPSSSSAPTHITHFPSAIYHKHIPTFSEQRNTTNTSYTRLSAIPTPTPPPRIHRTEKQKCFLYTRHNGKPILQHYGVFIVEISEQELDDNTTTLAYTLHRADRTLAVLPLPPTDIPPLPSHLPYTYADLLRYNIHFYVA